MEHRTRTNWLYRPTGLLFVFIVLLTFRTTAQDKYFGVGQYGSNYYGTIWSINADGTNPQTVFKFDAGSDGGLPQGQLVYLNGLLYGVAQLGGSSNYGVLFSMNPQTGQETILHTFSSSAPEGGYWYNYGGDIILYPDGKIYGITPSGGGSGQGAVWSYDPATGNFATLYTITDNPYNRAPSPPTLCNYKLYGTYGFGGGQYGEGYLYSYDPRTNVFTELYSFGAETSQATPMAVVDTLLYGFETSGGPSRNGILWSWNTVTNSGLVPVYSFDGTHGNSPQQIMPYKGKFYGLTQGGGASGDGVIFSFDPASGTYTDLHDFNSSEFDEGGFVIDSSGVMNGTVGYGGSLTDPSFSGNGVFFKYDLNANTYTEYDFAGASPANGANVPTFVPGTGGTSAQTLNFSSALTKTYGDPDFPGGATASSGLPVTYSSSDLTVAWINGGLIHIVGAGSCTITATQQGNSVYAPASATATLTVSQASLVIGVEDTTRYQFRANPNFVLTYTGFVYGDTVTTLLTPPAATTTADMSSPQGQYPITISGASATNYNITYQPGTLTIIGQAQDIEFTDTLKTYGDPDFASATVNTGLPLTYASSNPAVAIVSASGQIHITGAGQTMITVTQAGNADYGLTTLTTPLTVQPATLLIQVNNAKQTVGQPTPPFSAVYTTLVNGDTPDSLQTVFTCVGATPGAEPGVYLIYASAIRSQDSINYKILNNEPGSLFITPADGDTTSLDTWFNGPGSLQVNLFVTQQTPVSQPVALQVFDVTGRPALNTVLNLGWGNNDFTLPATMPAGIYIVRVTGNGINLARKVTKL